MASKKRISKVIIEHINGQPNEIATITLPLNQVIYIDESGNEENLSGLAWTEVKSSQENN